MVVRSWKVGLWVEIREKKKKNGKKRKKFREKGRKSIFNWKLGQKSLIVKYIDGAKKEKKRKKNLTNPNPNPNRLVGVLKGKWGF